MNDSTRFADLTFSQAFSLWLDSRVRIKPRTRETYLEYFRALEPCFGQVLLSQIHMGLVRQYQTQRATSAGPQRINHELNALLQVRRRARIADDFEELYEPLPLPYWQPPKTISDEQEFLFLEALRSRPQWELVYCYALLALKSGMSGSELRGIRFSDIDSVNRRVFVRNDSVKNKFRVRPVPLVDDAWWAIVRLKELATEKGSGAPSTYLFPFRIKRNAWDPSRPMTRSCIRRAWRQAREQCGIPDFTPHCMRHQANTKLYEAGADDMTVLEIMGWQSRQMSIHYSGIRDQNKRSAMERAFGKEGGASDRTNFGKAARSPGDARLRNASRSSSAGRTGLAGPLGPQTSHPNNKEEVNR
jgi:integrase